MIDVDMIVLNNIVDEVAENISANIEKQEKEDIEIPIGMFSNNKLISGYGPRVKIKIESFSNFSANLKTEFYSAGINQSIHRLYLDLSYNVILSTGLNSSTHTVHTQILLLESIIIGKIPEGLYNIEKQQ